MDRELKEITLENAERLTSGLAKLGGKVITRTSARPLAVSDSPGCSAVEPQLRQAAGTLAAMRERQ